MLAGNAVAEIIQRINEILTPASGGPGLEECFAMTMAVLKLALLAALAVVTLGVIPNRRIGAIVAIGICVAGAAILHFVAP